SCERMVRIIDLSFRRAAQGGASKNEKWGRKTGNPIRRGGPYPPAGVRGMARLHQTPAHTQTQNKGAAELRSAAPGAGRRSVWPVGFYKLLGGVSLIQLVDFGDHFVTAAVQPLL